ncbi:MAG: ribosome-binding ATPase [Patescibacteria group bacterium]|nr:ribosome-binding ATPase [Patescibacteria group bacterium]
MSSLRIGIVGLPNVGKSTLFNALTKAGALAANYPFATIEPNIGIVEVPDQRLNTLAEIYKSEKIIPAAINFVDIAGLVEGASKGEGLGNKFLSHIRECDAIAQVVRDFRNDDIVHVANRIHPEQDIEIIKTELILADISTLEKRILSFKKEAKANPKLKPIADLYQYLLDSLLQGNIPELSEEQRQDLKDLNLLSIKPTIYIFNVSEEDLNNSQKKQELESLVYPNKAIFVNAKLEEELRELDEQSAKELLQEYGQNESGLQKVITSAFDILGLQSYLTAGPKEVRAWTIKKGSTAPQAAGVIHGDFERGFIAAQIIDFIDLVETGSEAAAKAAGRVRTEGKTYIMQEGDVVEFRFNV